MNLHTSILLLAALYHESVRFSVKQGQTLAHAVGQPRPVFTEFADLPADALRGRMLTAELLLRTHDLAPLDSMMNTVQVEPDVDALARAIHRAERGAVRRGLVVVKLSPPRPWIPFEELPELAQNGRRHQARFFLSRFVVRGRAMNDIEVFDRARAAFLASPHGQASGGSQIRWTGTPAEVELLFVALEGMLGAEVGAWRCGPVTNAKNCVGMWRGVALYEDERGGGFAAEGVGGFTDPETGLWIETVTEGHGGPTLISSGVGHQLVPVSAKFVTRPDLPRLRVVLEDLRRVVEDPAAAPIHRCIAGAVLEASTILNDRIDVLAGTQMEAARMGPWKGGDCTVCGGARCVMMVNGGEPGETLCGECGHHGNALSAHTEVLPSPNDKLATSNVDRAELVRMLRAAQAERDDLVKQRLLLEDERDVLSRALRQAAEDSVVLAQQSTREAETLGSLIKDLQAERDDYARRIGQLQAHISDQAARMGKIELERDMRVAELYNLHNRSDRTQVLPDPNNGPDDPAGDDRTAAHISEVARAQDLLAATVQATSKVDAHGYRRMLQQVAAKSLADLRDLVAPCAIEHQARELIETHMPGEPPTALLRLAMGQAHVREAVDLLERVLQATATAESHRPLLWELDPELSGMVNGWREGLDSCSHALATAVRRYVDLAKARVAAL